MILFDDMDPYCTSGRTKNLLKKSLTKILKSLLSSFVVKENRFIELLLRLVKYGINS